MYKETLRSIAGIGLFPAFSLLLFIALFTLVLVHVFRMERGDSDRLASLPLDEVEGPGRDELFRGSHRKSTISSGTSWQALRPTAGAAGCTRASRRDGCTARARSSAGFCSPSCLPPPSWISADAR